MNKISKTYQMIGLLFWQYLVCGAVLGIFALGYPLHAILAFCLLLIFVTWHYQDKKIFRSVILFLVFALALLYARIFEPQESVENLHFYTENFSPTEYGEICGIVASVQGLSDRRLRVVLENVHKRDILGEFGNCSHAGQNLQGKVIYTHDKMGENNLVKTKRPLSGQIFQVKTKLRPFFGDLQAYYARQNAFYSAWNFGDKHPFTVQGEGNLCSAWRENLRHGFVQKLFGKYVSENINNDINEIFNSPQFQARAILLALLFGDKFYLSQDTLNDFNASNLLHSLALSGQHLSLVGVLALFLLCMVQRLQPQLYLQISKQNLLIYLGILLGFLYCWLGSAPYSLLRAYAMLTVGGIFYLQAKQITLLDLLFYALVFFIFLDPLSLYDLGVQLSFACVFAIAFCLPFLRFVYDKYCMLLPIRLCKITFSVFSLFFVSLAIQFAIAPILIVYFGQVSWFFMLNIIWLPVLTFWVMPLALFAFLCMGFAFSEILLNLAAVPVVLLAEFFISLRETDFYPFIQFLRPMGLEFLGFYLLLFVFFYAWKKNIPKADFFLAVGMIFLCIPTLLRFFLPVPDLQISLLDVGQGQAIYLQTKEKRLLLDVGGTNSRRFNVGRDLAAKFLTQNQSPALDMIIASHEDSDHINGIAPIIQTFSVGKLYTTCIAAQKQNSAKKKLDVMVQRKNLSFIPLGFGDYLDLGNGYGLKVLYPIKTSHKHLKKYTLPEYSSNNASLILRLVHKQKGLAQGIALFCGDSELEAMEKLLAMHKDNLVNLQADIFVLPHHGSEESFSPELYELINSRYVLASCGKYNRFGFPHKQVTKYFTSKNIPVHTTPTHGNIHFIHQNNQLVYNKKSLLQEIFSLL